MIDPRAATDTEFRDALGRLGFPASEEEQHELRRMAVDLREQAAELRRFLGETDGEIPRAGSPAGGPPST